jgi:hypothetical protein
MKVTPPPLSEGTDFRRMAVAESNGVYRFKLIKSAIFTFSDLIIQPPQRLSFRVNDKEWMRIEPHRVIISNGYAWNGCSIKRGIRILGRDVWLGTPDHDPGTIGASLIHDALFQFSGLVEMTFGLEAANDIFEQVCRANKFKLTWLYRDALDEFSHDFWGDLTKDVNCHEI